MLVKYRFITILFYVLLFTLSCNQRDNSRENTELEDIVINFPTHDSTIIPCFEGESTISDGLKAIYYFDGDCSFCFAKMRQLESIVKLHFGNVNLIFVAKTHDPSVFKWNLKGLSISSCVLIDSENSFETLNADNFFLGQFALLGSDNEVLIEGDPSEDDETLEKYLSVINKNDSSL